MVKEMNLCHATEGDWVDHCAWPSRSYNVMPMRYNIEKRDFVDRISY